MSGLSRNYKVKDVEMLITASTIIENAIANKAVLQAKRSTWADPFFEDLKIEIQTTTETYLGKDAAKDMRQATQIVLSIQDNALIDLAELKVQIEQDLKVIPFKKPKYLQNLGFQTTTNKHKKATKKP